MPNQSGKIVLVLILLLLILGIGVYLFSPGLKKQGYTEKTPDSSTGIVVDKEASKSPGLTKDYYSKNLEISFKVPEDAKVEESGDLLIKLTRGNVSIYRDGTNFSNIKDFFQDIKQKNKWNSAKSLEKKLRNYSVILVSFANKQKLYLVYLDNWVYYFSTSDESLYPVLDQIVESFEYKP